MQFSAERQVSEALPPDSDRMLKVCFVRDSLPSYAMLFFGFLVTSVIVSVKILAGCTQ